MLPEIIITSNTDGIIHINGTLLGQTGNSHFQSFIGAGSFLLSFTPITKKKIYAPVTVQVSVENQTPIFNCPYVSIFNYKGNTFFLEINSPCVASHNIPVCIAYKKLLGRFTASLIEQSSYFLVIEDDRKELADGFFPLSFGGVPTMETTTINGTGVIAISDLKERVYLFTGTGKAFNTALCQNADGYSFAGNSIEVVKTTTFGHKIKSTYTLNDNGLVLTKTDRSISNDFAQNTVVDFLDCILYKLEQKALSYLSPDLRISFSELTEFLGDFNEYKSSPFEQNAYALILRNGKDSKLVNRFFFEVIGNRINNIEEL